MPSPLIMSIKPGIRPNAKRRVLNRKQRKMFQPDKLDFFQSPQGWRQPL
jgi:hypothetical protein